MRRFVIGDIHGCSKALRTLIETIAPTPEDEIVFLGDYVDRGPDSRGVIDQVIELQEQCRVVALLGNHEIMLRGVAMRGLDPKVWLASGGHATVASYGGSLSKMPESHENFFCNLQHFYETSDNIFVHACYEYHLPMDQQSEEMMFWSHLTHPLPPPHSSGKRVFVGHTPQPGGVVLDMGYLVCVDTYCFGHGYLTAMNVATNEMYQVDRKGFRRRVPAEDFIAGVRWAWKRVRKLIRSSPVEQRDA
ncbi:metallophosphoesterase family protein [Stieleria varia]|uniref:Serine/threonine-protein phosphatase 1 n=1 Tax=Stieleria varia TaxID=2528005 RepID=A0A5C6AGA5_9BACT|nr:metallophosphoesterase family protein [Stieleria varia]TWT98436.1 Serine/threonine-protein phosphatase 1 [Stieleria varia]